MSENQALSAKLAKLTKLKSESDHINESTLNEVNNLKQSLHVIEGESGSLQGRIRSLEARLSETGQEREQATALAKAEGEGTQKYFS